MYLFLAEAEFVHGSGMKIFDKDISALDKLGQNLFSVRSSGVESDRFLIRVELEEVVAWFIGVKLKFVTGSVTSTGTFYFNNLGTKPCEELCT